MKIIDDAVEIGIAPEFAVTGTAAIERVSDGQVRLAYFSQRSGVNVITFYVTWSTEQFEATRTAYERFRETEMRDIRLRKN